MDGDWYCRGIRLYDTHEERDDSGKSSYGHDPHHVQQASSPQQQNSYMDDEKEEVSSRTD